MHSKLGIIYHMCRNMLDNNIQLNICVHPLSWTSSLEEIFNLELIEREDLMREPNKFGRRVKLKT